MRPGEPRLARARLAGPLLQLPVVLAVAWAAFSFGLEPGLLALAVAVAVWPPQVPWRPVAARAVLLGYLPFAVAWLLFVVLWLRTTHACGWTIPPQAVLEQMAREGLAMPGLPLVVVGIVAIAPVFEEIVFRGYVFTALDQVLPRWATQLGTAVAFGAMHGAGYSVPIGVLALFFGWLRARSGSLLPSILAHAVHNGLTVAVTLSWPGHLEYLYPDYLLATPR